MSTNNINNLESFLNNWQCNAKYFEMLQLISRLSKLFSNNQTPFIDYRIAENVFCKYYEAMNDARSCTAYDARLSGIGIGIKTFILSDNDSSMEKIAEFNKLRPQLLGLDGLDLARKLGEFRNERMRFADAMYDVTETQYHIVGRKVGKLRIFNTPYEKIDVQRIHHVKEDDRAISFTDDINEYSFNKSKSVLQKRFFVPDVFKDVDVDIIDDPYELLEKLFVKKTVGKVTASAKRGSDYVILPLYSQTKKGCFVPEKSGLNQFNAGGRKRNELEVYIPVPAKIHHNYPGFFPDKDTPFALHLPDGKVLSAKICQQGDKALMSNPNSALGEWLLRKVLKKKPWELVTMDDLDRLGFDSVCVEDLHSVNENGERKYRMSFSAMHEDYTTFINERS